MGKGAVTALPAFHSFGGDTSRCHSQLCPGRSFSSSPTSHRSVWSPGQGTNAPSVTFKQKATNRGQEWREMGDLMGSHRSPPRRGLFRAHFGGKHLNPAQTLPVAPLSVSAPRHDFPTHHLQSQCSPSCSSVLSLCFLAALLLCI